MKKSRIKVNRKRASLNKPKQVTADFENAKWAAVGSPSCFTAPEKAKKPWKMPCCGDGTDIPRSLHSHVHVGMSTMGKGGQWVNLWAVLPVKSSNEVSVLLRFGAFWWQISHFSGKNPPEDVGWWTPTSIPRAHRFCCPIFIPAGSPSQPLFAVLSPLACPHHVKTQTGLSFFSSLVPLCCFPPAQETSGTKHCRAHLAVYWKGHCCHVWDLLLGQRKGSFRTSRGRNSGWHKETLEGTYYALLSDI